MKFILTATDQLDWDLESLGFKKVAHKLGYTYFENTEIEINTIEELLEFSKKCGYELVIDPDEPSIEIYNGYRE